MTVTQITCDNCGAKGKLPESFTGTQAKCPKCGSAIDVQKQRAAAATTGPAAAAKPAAAKPAAAARPAIDRSKERAPSERPARAARPARSGDGEKEPPGASADDGGGKGHRSRAERPAKKGNSTPLVAGGIGLVALIVVGVVMMNQGDPPKDVTANAPPASTKPAEQPAPHKPAVEAPAKPAEPAPAATPAPKPDEPVEADPTPADVDPSRIKRPWEKMRNPPQTIDQVTDPKTYPEVQWAAEIDDAKKAAVRALVDDVANGGRAGIQAKPKLVEQHDFAALFAIVEKLRTLDYRSPEDSMLAFEFNKLLEQITGGLNARFEPVEATETIPPAKAEWNTRSVKGWMDLLARLPDTATFRQGRAERLKKQAK